jgi:acyl carrier protein
MTRPEIQAAVAQALTSVAPEVDAATLKVDVPLRDQVDLDSMDWLNFLVGLHARLGVDIPEADYRKLVTLDDLLAYLGPRQPAASGGAG